MILKTQTNSEQFKYISKGKYFVIPCKWFSGYKFISEQVAIIDKNNPPVAARLILPLTRFNNYTSQRKNKIKTVLRSINKSFISNDLSEIIEKALI